MYRVSLKKLNISSSRHLRLYYQNVRGLNTKLTQLYLNVLPVNYDVLVFTETWLTDSIRDSELLDQRYNIYRTDRNRAVTGKTRGGGVLIAVNDSFIHQQQQISSDLRNIELLCVKIQTK